MTYKFDVPGLVDLIRTIERQKAIELFEATLKVAFSDGLLEGSQQISNIANSILNPPQTEPIPDEGESVLGLTPGKENS